MMLFPHLISLTKTAGSPEIYGTLFSRPAGPQLEQQGRLTENSWVMEVSNLQVTIDA